MKLLKDMLIAFTYEDRFGDITERVVQLTEDYKNYFNGNVCCLDLLDGNKFKQFTKSNMSDIVEVIETREQMPKWVFDRLDLTDFEGDVTNGFYDENTGEAVTYRIVKLKEISVGLNTITLRNGRGQSVNIVLDVTDDILLFNGTRVEELQTLRNKIHDFYYYGV